MGIKIKRAAVTVTFRCTLKCKLCSVDITKYDKPKHFTLDELKKMISRFMDLIDYVEEFELAGGEALIHENIDEIIEYSMQYKDKFDKLYIFTNGTIIPKDNVWKVIKKYNKDIKFFISNYGEVSSRVEELKVKLAEFEIEYKEKIYHGVDLHCGGWVDFGDFSETPYDYKTCYYLNSDWCIQIRGGEVHMCGRCYRGMELGVVEKTEDEYLDIMKEDFDVEKEKVHLQELINLEELTVCKYCNGLRPDSERFKPAEQLRK